jgi:peptidyl-prolyl cis-trans isomerase C
MQSSLAPSRPDDRRRERSPEAMSVGSSRLSLHRVPWRRWLREPLLHFLVAGVAIFGAYRMLHPNPDPSEQPRRIVLTEGDLRQISVVWLAQGRPPPTPEQMKSLVEGKVREEVLVREALALGLDKDDAIIKRRLAQKMDFLFEDLAAMREPTSTELEAWFAKNAERFALPPRASFRLLYFSPDRRGTHAYEDAAQALAKLAGESKDAPVAAALADPFMFQSAYGDRTPEQLLKLFGPNFAKELFRLKPGSWQGPIRSGYGWHLVWIDEIVHGRVPDLSEVEPDVKAGWLQDQQDEVRRKAFEAMRARYTVVLPPLDTAPVSSSPDAAAFNAAQAAMMRGE